MRMRVHPRHRAAVSFAALLVAALLSTAASCPTKPVTLIGESGLAVAVAIGHVQGAVRQLTDAGAIPPATALAIQSQLLRVNSRLEFLPNALRAADALLTAGSSADEPLDQAVAILRLVSRDLSIVVAGVPISMVTQPLLDLTVAAQETVVTTLVAVAKLRGARR